MLQADLKILGGKHQGKLISLNTKKFLVGREQDCHLRPNSELVSRHHCVFSIDDYSVRLRDLGSTNGTLVNGQPIRGEMLLKSGDRVSIGKLELEVVIRQASGKPPSSASSSSLSAVEKPQQVLTTAEIATQTADTDTSYSLPSYAPTPPSDYAISPPADTAIIDTVPPQPQFAQPPGMGYPQPYPGMMPPGYPMPGAYMPPAYPGYPQPGYGQMPGYGQPMGYPMGYPQMPQQAYPGVAVTPPPAVPEVPAAAPVEAMAVRLPDPAETGVKAVAVPPPAAPGAAGAPKKEEKPSTTAADIIKSYMSRRT